MGRAARQLNLSGVFAAALTPIRAGTLDLDYSAFLDRLDLLAGAKVDGVCVMGSTGEFLNHSFSERQRAVYLGAKRSRVPLIVGVGHSTLAGALQLAEEAIAAGADALLVMPPFFFRYEQTEIAEFFRVFAEETGDAVPLLLYNIPQFTSPIASETARRLLTSGLYAGIKDSSGDWNYFKGLLEFRDAKPFALFAGHDRIAPCALRTGADGLISGCAAAIPELLVAMAKARGSNEAANNRLNEFIAWVERFPAPVAIRRAAELRGAKPGPYAVPFDQTRTAELQQFSDWFKAWWPATLAELQA